MVVDDAIVVLENVTACRIQVDERCNQRYGNGDGDNQRGSPAPKEEEHHNDNEQQGVQQLQRDEQHCCG